MAKVFIDANFLFDISERERDKKSQLEGHKVYISPLSFHILFYIYKYKIPSKEIIELKEEFYMADFTDKILSLALQGPSSDLEDNIQLHSAAIAECDYFLTNDKNLLKMKFFGKTAIKNRIEV